MKKNNLFSMILIAILIINIFLFMIQFNGLKFLNTMIPITGNMLLFILLGCCFYLEYFAINDSIKKKKTVVLFGFVVNLIFLTLNLGMNYVDNIVQKISSNEEIYTSTILVSANSTIYSIDDLLSRKIGVSGNEQDYENYKLGYDYLDENNKVTQNEFYRYDDYKLALNDLLNGKIDALIISGNYLDLYGEYFSDLENKVRPIINTLSYSYKKEIEVKKSLDEPFTVLVIGADGKGGATYNADVLILMTINPNTKKVVMVDVVRDTYTYNFGNQKMDKITHSGWYGTENVVNTVSNLFNIPIDYYVRMNFSSVTNLVDMLGGVTINVPYRYIVKPQNGKNYYIESGLRNLNGIETLWLARTRKEAGSSLLTRGEMQMTIIEQLIKQVNGNFLVSNFLDIFDLISNNVVTNIRKQDLYYYIQKYISIKDELLFEHNQLKGSDSSYYHEGMKTNLYMYQYDENSLIELKNKLFFNLEP